MGPAGALGATNVAGIKRAAGVTGATAVTGVLGATGVMGSQVLFVLQVLWVPQVLQLSQMPLMEGEAKSPTRGLSLGCLPSLPGWVWLGGGRLGGLLLWIMGCLLPEWSPTGITRPVGGWMPQGLEAGALSC